MTRGGEIITSGAWIAKKFKALRGQMGSDYHDQVLAGGRGILV
jgi:hypothetical protein